MGGCVPLAKVPRVMVSVNGVAHAYVLDEAVVLSVIGGLVVTTVATLFVVPAIFERYLRWRRR